MTQPSPPEWLDVVMRLCRNGFDPDGSATGGAQVQVFDRATDQLVYRQPIAREIRLDDEEPLLWFRQIVGDAPPFDLDVCRRRSLFTTDAAVDGVDRVTFPQPQATTGEYGIILAADPDQVPLLDAWDTWKLSATTAEEEARLDALTDDS
ncbi:hypothetical protein [Mycobacterium hubeiense]|uniref:hypothetical protein n=1 Tax=Mycobacterium hubeiense TaxID=1867256 RepID=UPI000C7EAE39|nr:hypothetical protein [Mycobacterium sp. QGD 101]